MPLSRTSCDCPVLFTAVSGFPAASQQFALWVSPGTRYLLTPPKPRVRGARQGPGLGQLPLDTGRCGRCARRFGLWSTVCHLFNNHRNVPAPLRACSSSAGRWESPPSSPQRASGCTVGAPGSPFRRSWLAVGLSVLVSPFRVCVPTSHPRLDPTG